MAEFTSRQIELLQLLVETGFGSVAAQAIADVSLGRCEFVDTVFRREGGGSMRRADEVLLAADAGDVGDGRALQGAEVSEQIVETLERLVVSPVEMYFRGQQLLSKLEGEASIFVATDRGELVSWDWEEAREIAEEINGVLPLVMRWLEEGG
jgi:hypothetical protein